MKTGHISKYIMNNSAYTTKEESVSKDSQNADGVLYDLQKL